MHLTDTLVSAPVAIVAGAISIALIVFAAKRAVTGNRRNSIVLMAIMAAFIFAAQMITFNIPGTGTSGHIVGGVLLAALLGPWCGFLTLCAVVIVQCVLFGDGGLMALGCNILNMGVMGCLVAYPLFYRPLMRYPASQAKLMGVSILASTVALELGAVSVSVETVLSATTSLSLYSFLSATLPVHLAIGICEGVVTGMVLIFVQSTSPDMLHNSSPWGVSNTAVERVRTHNRHLTLLTLGIVTIAMGVAFALISAHNPEGFNWLAANVGQLPNLAPASRTFTVVIPDYSSRISGIIGIGIILTTIFVIGMITYRSKRRKAQAQPSVIHRYY